MSRSDERAAAEAAVRAASFGRWSVRTPSPGTAPGEFQADPQAEPTVVDVVVYGREGVQESHEATVAVIRDLRGRSEVCWVDVQGLRDAQFLREIAELFGIHPLALEDIVHVEKNPEIFSSEPTVVLGDQPEAVGLVTVEAKLAELGDRVRCPQHADQACEECRLAEPAQLRCRR